MLGSCSSIDAAAPGVEDKPVSTHKRLHSWCQGSDLGCEFTQEELTLGIFWSDVDLAPRMFGQYATILERSFCARRVL